MKLLNVRLNADDARLAAQLRDAGIEISRVVREAIRAEHGRRAGRQRPRASELMAAIYAAHPDPPGLRPRRHDARDRRGARRVIVRKLRRRRA
jgi:post-segregation antitoxin (ccd killing protein)